MKPGSLQISSQALLLVLLAACALPVTGCEDEGATVGDKLEILSGNHQTGLPGEDLSPLVVRVLGPRRLDFFGRRMERHPVGGVPVTFEVELVKKKPVPAPASSTPSPERGASGGAGSPEAPAESGPAATQPDSATPGGAGAAVPGAPAAEPAGKPKSKKGEPSAEGSAALAAHPVLRALDGGGAAPPPDQGASGRTTKVVVISDADGFARVAVRLGAQNGLWNVEASIPRDDVRFRLASGVAVEVSDREAVVGSRILIQVTLQRLERPDDPKSLVPVPNRQIEFRLAGTPFGADGTASLKDKRNDTDARGQRDTELTLGDQSGVYHVLAEIESDPGDDPLPPISLSFVAMDWFSVLLKVASGVLVFLVGVRLLGRGFLLLTSGYMHLPTGPWAQSRFRGYFGGILSGIVFESSSLVSSHLVSLTNGGLLTAGSALGLLLGAYVGGTMLPQFLAHGIGWLATPFLAVGILFLLIPRRIGLLSWGWVFLGGGLILTGWSMLEEAAVLTGLSERLRTALLDGGVDYSRPFAVYASKFFTYMFFAAAGAFLLRTSNLMVVLAMLLAAHGMIRLPTAIPLVLGANLGSAAMVFVLSIPKRREARRLALAGFVLQLLGCAVAVALSLPVVQGLSPLAWIVEILTPGRTFAAHPANAAQHIAGTHTIYNLATGIAFLFFPRRLTALVDRIVPAQAPEDQVKPYILDRNLITVPALAMRQATEETIYLTEMCRKTVAEAFDSFRYNDLDLSEQVVRREEVISSIHREVSQYLVEVGENQLSKRDAVQFEILQTSVSSLVRIGGMGERLRDLTARKIEEKVTVAEDVDRDLSEVYDLVMAQFSNILRLLRERDTKTEENAVKMLERIAKISARVESHWRQRIEEIQTPVSPLEIHVQTMVYQEAFGILFRIAGHLAHIAERMRILRPDRY